MVKGEGGINRILTIYHSSLIVPHSLLSGISSPLSSISMSDYLLALRDDITQWCQGRIFWWRVPILLYLAWAFWHNFRDPFYWTIFGGITLGIHELGHVIFGFAGEFMMVAGGSLAQLAAPSIASIVFLYQRDYFGISVAGGWLSLSLLNLATYIADAQARELPLVSIGGGSDVIHDWEYLLMKFGLLHIDTTIGGLTRLLGLAVMIASMVLGIWLCVTMSRGKNLE
jgi:hypothetical protein